MTVRPRGLLETPLAPAPKCLQFCSTCAPLSPRPRRVAFQMATPIAADSWMNGSIWGDNLPRLALAQRLFVAFSRRQWLGRDLNVYPSRDKRPKTDRRMHASAEAGRRDS